MPKQHPRLIGLFVRRDPKIRPWAEDSLAKYIVWREDRTFPTLKETKVWYEFRLVLNDLIRRRHSDRRKYASKS